jgi:hypothetical protein
VRVDWERICVETVLRKLSVWDEFYRNLFLDRVETLTEVRMSETTRIVLGELGDPAFADVDTCGFIWCRFYFELATSVKKFPDNNF